MMPALQTLIQEACEYGPKVEFWPNYSGRGMYGSPCVAIVGHRQDCQQLIATVIQTMADSLEWDTKTSDDLFQQFNQYVERIMQYDWDTMGFDQVWYWPDLKFVAEPDPT
jgi:hypothetical protein